MKKRGHELLPSLTTFINWLNGCLNMLFRCSTVYIFWLSNAILEEKGYLICFVVVVQSTKGEEYPWFGLLLVSTHVR
jgi:hypothetical protein